MNTPRSEATQRIGGETGSAALPNRTTRIIGWGHEVPAAVVTNNDLERIVDTTDEWIVSRTGIRERRIAGAGVTSATLGAIAAARALAVAGIDADAIDLIVVHHQPSRQGADATFHDAHMCVEDQMFDAGVVHERGRV